MEIQNIGSTEKKRPFDTGNFFYVQTFYSFNNSITESYHSWLISHICGQSETDQEVKLKRQGAVSLFQSSGIDAVTDISGQAVVKDILSNGMLS